MSFWNKYSKRFSYLSNNQMNENQNIFDETFGCNTSTFCLGIITTAIFNFCTSITYILMLKMKGEKKLIFKDHHKGWLKSPLQKVIKLHVHLATSVSHAFLFVKYSLDLTVILKFLPRFIENLNLKCNERRLKEEIWQQPFRFYSSSSLIMEESGPGHLSAL